MRLSRRQLLQASLVGGLAGTFGTLESGWLGPALPVGTAPGGGPLGTYEILNRAIRLGKHISVGGATARAGTIDEMAVVTIKVMNLIHSPLVFKLGQLNAGGTDTLPYTGSTAGTNWAGKISDPAVLTKLMALGVDKPSDIARFQNLRMNKWFASILNSGTDDGTANVPNVLTAADIGPFPAETDVAIQAALGVNQTDLSLNHSYQNCAMLKNPDASRGGDLGYHLAKQKLVTSPLGLICFNMGIVTETTDSIGNVGNRVVANDLVTQAASGQSVGTMVDILRQAVGLGLIDDALVAKFDALVNADTTLTTSLKNNRATLIAALAAMTEAKTMETQTHVMAASSANLQASGTSANPVSPIIAKSEFLAQCKFVQRALQIPGKPFRNFNLFLNLVDLDGLRLDVAPAVSGIANPLSYVEGMRQLAIGLNMLAQVIKQHTNVYVVVVSEGGRDNAFSDSKVSHTLIMGPGGAGRLKDYLYADMAAISSTNDPFVADPNNGNVSNTGTGQKIPTGNTVFTEAGAPVADRMTTGALLNGLVRHIETVKAAAPTTAGLGNRVNLQTK